MLYMPLVYRNIQQKKCNESMVLLCAYVAVHCARLPAWVMCVPMGVPGLRGVATVFTLATNSRHYYCGHGHVVRRSPLWQARSVARAWAVLR